MKIKKYLDKILFIGLITIVLIIGIYNRIKSDKIDNTNFISESIEETDIKDLDEDNSKENSKNDIEEDKKEIVEEIYVDISGCVLNPGVYKLDVSKRVIDAVDKAGGFCDNVDTRSVNLSQKLQDEMKIYIYEKDEEVDNSINSSIGTMNILSENSNSKININNASLDQLMTLPSIGKTRAEEIINYRETNKFNTIEDIKNISGIGEKTFEKLKDKITVN